MVHVNYLALCIELHASLQSSLLGGGGGGNLMLDLTSTQVTEAATELIIKLSFHGRNTR